MERRGNLGRSRLRVIGMSPIILAGLSPSQEDKDNADRGVGMCRSHTIRDDLVPGEHTLECELLDETKDPGGGKEFRIISVMRLVLYILFAGGTRVLIWLDVVFEGMVPGRMGDIDFRCE
jgi:hypothetical protein